MSLDICECLWVSINVCAVFRRGVHIAQTLGARRGHWPDWVAQSGGLLTFYDPTPLSARFSSKTSNIQNQMECCPKYVGFAFQICQMNSRGASSPLGMQSEPLWLRWKMFERRGRTVPGWAESGIFFAAAISVDNWQTSSAHPVGGRWSLASTHLGNILLIVHHLIGFNTTSFQTKALKLSVSTLTIAFNHRLSVWKPRYKDTREND